MVKLKVYFFIFFIDYIFILFYKNSFYLLKRVIRKITNKYKLEEKSKIVYFVYI